MKVLKFGGSSVASAENIEKVVAIVQAKSAGQPVVLVVSALGGITDCLINIGKSAEQGDETYKQQLIQIEQRHIDTIRLLIPVAIQSAVISEVKKHLNNLENILEGVFLIGELSAKTLDKIVSFGELLSSYIVSQKLKVSGLDSSWKDAKNFIKTDANYGNASVDFELTNSLIREQLLADDVKVVVVPGFVASNKQQITTTLGRGGSDYTAAIIAAALGAEDLEIWTDVSGMMTADPRVVSQAYTIKRISYQEAMELSHFGAKVIYPPTIQPVMDAGIPVWIKNTFAPSDVGTVIENEQIQENNKNATVTGISSINQISLLNLEGAGMVGIPGISKRLFGALAQAQINVILITQASSEHSICVAVKTEDADTAKRAVDEEFSTEINHKKISPLIIESGLSVVALVGDQMRHKPGISGKMFSCLGKNGINIRAISQGSSERNISAIISYSVIKKALNALHEEFFEQPLKQINLFLAGVGNVGGKLLEQIEQQSTILKNDLKLNIRVIGMANSKVMLFDEEGISLANWRSVLVEKGIPLNLNTYAQKVFDMNMRNSIFVDNTAHQEIANLYELFLKNSVSVVASNKIACSSPYSSYKSLKTAALNHHVSFCYETNVGAGLPIIGTLADMVKSGDQIISIKAVLSGTMNFVFSNFISGVKFVDVVKQAQQEGYTEPDPRIDLSGVDVARKILILARECGAEMDLQAVENAPFMPEDCLSTTSVEAFYEKLNQYTTHFDNMREEADKKGKRLKYVATFENGKAKVGVEAVDVNHPFYNLAGKDNMVIFSTTRYKDQPMIVKGAGAGADVTASGVFADIIRSVR